MKIKIQLGVYPETLLTEVSGRCPVPYPKSKCENKNTSVNTHTTIYKTDNQQEPTVAQGALLTIL